MLNSRFKLFFTLLSFIALSTHAQKQPCDKIKNGTFYFYPSKSPGNAYVIVRKDTLQKELDANSQDTSYWKANWQDGCVLELVFIGTNKPMPTAERNFMKAHLTILEIKKVTNQYYVFSGGIQIDGKIMGAMQDTMWFKPKVIKLAL